MKKVILFLVVGIGALCTLSSCLQNEEPAGVENLRNAKSELIKAEAQYKAAEIALVQAEAALKETIRAGYELDNKLKELDVQLKEAQVAYETARLELQKALDAAENEKEIARLQAEAAQYLLNKQNLENQRELAIEQHKANMVNAQAALAQAEYNYQEVLNQIELASTGLTAAEKEMINTYRGEVEGIREKLAEARVKLLNAQEKLVNVKYDFNKDRLLAQNQRLLENQQLQVDLKKAEIAEVEALDLDGGAGVWQTQVEEIEAAVEALEAQVTQLKLDAEAKKADMVEPQAEIDKLTGEKKVIEDEITALEDQIYDLTADYNVNMEFTLEIPERFQNTVYYTAGNFYYWLNQNYVVWQENFEYNDKTGQFYLPTGQLAWTTTLYMTYFAFANADYNSIPAAEKLSATALMQWNDWLTEAKYTYEESSTGSKALYERNSALFEEGLADFKELAAEYGYVNYNTNTLKDENLYAAAEKAFAAFYAYENQSDPDAEAPTPAVIKGWIDAIRAEQEVREQMTGTAVDDYAKLTYENYSSDAAAENHITFAAFEAAMSNMYNYPAIDYQGLPDMSGFVYGDDATKWSAAEKWYTSSDVLYGAAFVPMALTEEHYANIEEVTFNFNDPMSNPFIWINEEFYSVLNDLGLYATNVTNYVWGQNYLDAQRIEYIEDVIANYNTEVDAFLAVVDAFDAQYGLAAMDEIQAEVLDLRLQIAEKENELIALDKAIEEQKAIIEDVQEEIDMLVKEDDADNIVSQVELLNRQIASQNSLKETLETLIKNNYIEINGSQYEPNSDEAEQALAAWVEDLYDELTDLEDKVAATQKTIDLLNSNESPEEYYIKVVEGEVEDAQAVYDALLEQFNFYNDLLKELMAAIIGGEELPETPETPAA